MHKDYLGRDIKVGDTVVYPGRHGSSMWLTHGTVVELTSLAQWGRTGKTVPAVKIEIETTHELPVYPKDEDGNPMFHRIVDGKKMQITPTWETRTSKRVITSVILDRMVVIPIPGPKAPIVGTQEVSA